MLIGYMRVSKTDGSQATDLQLDALVAAAVAAEHIYEDMASGRKDDRPGLVSCLKALREGDTLVVWKLDRLGRNLRHLINTVHDLTARGVGLKVLSGHGAAIDTTTAAGKLVFGIFAALAEFERDLIRERTNAGLAAARARGRTGGRPSALSADQVRAARRMYEQKDMTVAQIGQVLGVSRTTIYRALNRPPAGAAPSRRATSAV